MSYPRALTLASTLPAARGQTRVAPCRFRARVCAALFATLAMIAPAAFAAGAPPADRSAAEGRLLGGTLPGTTLQGITPAGSAYRIAVPAGWAEGDGLVLLQHGYSFASTDEPDFGPSAARMLADGYAIAAPGYRRSGWALFDAVDDNADVLAAFRARVGVPGRILAHGGSMGALIALKLAESERLQPHIDGVVALCPTADGVGFWDRVFDLRLAYDSLCADVPGGQLPAGAAPTPWAANPDVMSLAPTDPLDFAAAARALAPIQACLGLHSPPAERTPAQASRVQSLAAFAATQDEDALAVQLIHAYYGLSDLLRSPDQLDQRNPFYNRLMHGGVTDLLYGHARALRDRIPANFDAGVARVVRDDFARLRFHESSSLDGTVRVPVVSIHTDRDGVVPAAAQGFLTHRLAGTSVSHGVVSEASASHCGFSQGEYDAAWEVAREWVESGEAAIPQAADLQAVCVARDSGPCRFDGEATAAALNAAERGPRQSLRELESGEFDVQSFGGLWWDPARPAQGLMIEELDDPVSGWGAGEQRVALAWYTWAPQGDPNPGPRWFYGVGRVYGTALSVDLLEVRGGRFGTQLDVSQVSRVPWGRVEIAFDAALGPTLRYTGPAGYGSGEMQLQKLMAAGTGLGNRIAFSPPLMADFERAGTYFDPQRAAGGWVLNQDLDATNIRSLLVWFTWDADGRPLWLYGLDPDDRDGLAFPMIRPVSGGRFEPGYPLSQVQFLPWGEVLLEGDSCVAGAVTSVEWRAAMHGFGDGRVDVSRLTEPTILHAVPDCSIIDFASPNSQQPVMEAAHRR